MWAYRTTYCNLYFSVCETRRNNQSNDDEKIAGELLMIYTCIFHVLSHLLLIYICKLHWNDIAIVEAKSKADDDVQQGRKQDAIRRQKQFISNALEDIETKAGEFLLIYIWNFHVLSRLLFIYIFKLHWNLNTMFVCQVNYFWFTYVISMY